MNAKRLIVMFAGIAAIAIAIGLCFRSVKTNRLEPTTSSDTVASTVPEGFDTDSSQQSAKPSGVPDNVVTNDKQPEESEPIADDILPIVSEDSVAEEIPPEIVPDENAIARLCIGGDTSIDSEFADAANRWGVDYPWKDVSEVFGSADIAIVNLETCVSERGVSEKREGYGFRTPPNMLEGFVNAGIDMVNLANNHTRDFGYDALLDTFTHLTEYNIDYFGAGEDIDRAQGLVIKDVNGIKIGFAAANQVGLSTSCAAAEGHAGISMVYKMNDERTLAFLEKIKEYDAMCDVLIVFMHCGIEETFDINTYQKDFSRALIDSGADIVVGGHPHTLQPIEFYNDKPIIYSIGNLIFWHIDDEIDGLTAIFDITIDKNGFKSLKLHPLFIKNYKVYYLKDGEGKFPTRYNQIIELMNSLCNKYGLAFDSEGNMVEYVPIEETAEEPQE